MFEKYIETIQELTFNIKQDALPKELLIETDGEFSIFYAPFDFINKQAKIIICGITPGLQQAHLALNEASQKLKNGDSLEKTQLSVKKNASFGGAMRKNLIKLLNHINIPQILNIDSCAELFNSQSRLLHSTSALRYPVFKSLKNYSGSPSILKTPLLRKQVEKYLLPELSSFNSSTLIIPLGSKVEEVLNFAVDYGAINDNQILSGLPHPSGANSERISYFLGEKSATQLSNKTNPLKIDLAREQLMAKVIGLKMKG